MLDFELKKQELEARRATKEIIENQILVLEQLLDGARMVLATLDQGQPAAETRGAAYSNARTSRSTTPRLRR